MSNAVTKLQLQQTSDVEVPFPGDIQVVIVSVFNYGW